ncbi:MAG: putative phosphoribosyl transferase [Chthoniobacteraceae bacterium]|nr:putative phosphoribosyl transferase [Chthoniobacteraceae bacterium]
MREYFQDRTEAGQLLAARLSEYADRHDVLVLGLPRGGVPVAFEVAKRLHAPLDVFVVRKLGLPAQKELAMGAIASGNVRVLNESVCSYVPERLIDAVTAREKKELERRERAYRGHEKRPAIEGKIVLLIDDGIATGATMLAAVQAVRLQHPARIVVAVPTAPPSTCQRLSSEAEEVVALMMPEPFHAVGQWYLEFSQTSDTEVTNLLAKAAALQCKGRQAEPR